MEQILLIVAILGLILSTLFFTKRDGFKKSTFFLGAFYFIISLYCFQTWVIESRLLLYWKWFYVWPLPLYALLAPALYFYFISIIADEFRWKWSFLILFVPSLLALIDVLAVYNKPVQFYQEIIENALQKPKDRFESKYGLFTLKWHFLFRNSWVLLALIVLFFKLRVFFSQKSSTNFPIKTVNWLKTLYGLGFVLAVFSVYLSLVSIFRLEGSQLATPAYLMFLFYALVLILGVTPLYFPSILYGLPRLAFDPKEQRTSNQDTHKQMRAEEEGLRFGIDEPVLLDALKELEAKELYLQSDFNLDRLAAELEMPVHHISYFLNHHYNQSFSEYRTSLRMKMAQTLIEEGFFEQNTIEALAWKCGFSSRSAFTKAFKLYTGVNPSAYPLK